MKSKSIIKGVLLATLTLVVAAGSAAAANLTPKEKLGKNLYFDIRLSSPAGQSCASCHSPGAGFNGFGDANIPVIEGAVSGKFGNRNAPSAAYASFSPSLAFVSDGSEFLSVLGRQGQDSCRPGQGTVLKPGRDEQQIQGGGGGQGHPFQLR